MDRTMTVFIGLGFALMATACAAPTPSTGSDAPDVGVTDEALRLDYARTCPVRQCGPQLGLPNQLCSDGTTVSGPTGRCLRQQDGSCGWEVIQCPNPVCAVASVGAAGAETKYYARNFSAPAQAKAWSSRFEDANVDILPGTCASQRLACPQIFQPVCAVVSGSSQQTFANRCALRTATIAAAGDSGAAKSSVRSDGSCPKACAASAQCDEGEHCSVEDGDCNRPPGCKPGDVCPALCYGVCVPNPSEPPEGPFCGGIAGVKCPGSGHCQDDPSDSCDPNNGGADCGGVCVCIENVLCVQGSHFNSDPSVCACQPDGPQCGTRVCAADQICCSPSCGICGPRGGLCPQIVCQTPLN